MCEKSRAENELNPFMAQNRKPFDYCCCRGNNAAAVTAATQNLQSKRHDLFMKYDEGTAHESKG